MSRRADLEPNTAHRAAASVVRGVIRGVVRGVVRGRLPGVTLAVAAALLGPGRVAAHHGGALFDPATTVTVTGTVTEFQFVNPHVLIYLAVPDADGTSVRWGGELTSPNRLARMNTPVGWHKGLLAPGDEITMTGHPARNGAPAMDIEKIVDADGRVLIGQ